MKVSMHPFFSATTLLIATLAVCPMVHAEVIKAQTDEQSIGSVGKEEERNALKDDLTYKQRATSLAKQYETTAKLVASQGGDPKPLLAAAAYFASQSK